MASTASSNLQLTHLEQNQNNPDVLLNTQLDRIDGVLAGASTISFAATTVLSCVRSMQNWTFRWRFASTTASSVFNIASRKKLMLVDNKGAHQVTVKIKGGTGSAVVSAAARKLLYSDGIEIVEI